MKTTLLFIAFLVIPTAASAQYGQVRPRSPGGQHNGVDLGGGPPAQAAQPAGKVPAQPSRIDAFVPNEKLISTPVGTKGELKRDYTQEPTKVILLKIFDGDTALARIYYRIIRKDSTGSPEGTEEGNEFIWKVDTNYLLERNRYAPGRLEMVGTQDFKEGAITHTRAVLKSLSEPLLVIETMNKSKNVNRLIPIPKPKPGEVHNIRTWTYANGDRQEAQFYSFEGGVFVNLLLPDGSFVKYGIERFSAKDQKYIKDGAKE